MQFWAAAISLAMLVIALPSASIEVSPAVDPAKIVSKAFGNLYGFSSVQQVEISSGTADEKKFIRSAQVIRAGAATGLNRMLVRFNGPPDLRGVGILLRERPNYQYDAFLYQPILKKVRRVSVYQRQDRFFGTDLAFEDLEGKRAAQWNARLLRSEMKLDRKTWVIEITPIGFPSGYERIIGWFDQERPVVVHFEFYLGGQNDKKHKALDLLPSEVVEKDGYYIPTQLRFSGAHGTETIVRISEIDIRESLPDSIFSPSTLERGSLRTDAAGAKSH